MDEGDQAEEDDEADEQDEADDRGAQENDEHEPSETYNEPCSSRSEKNHNNRRSQSLVQVQPVKATVKETSNIGIKRKAAFEDEEDNTTKRLTV